MASATAVVVAPAMVAVKMATKMATPNTKPNCLPVLMTPEPTPRDLSGSEPIPAAVRAGMEKVKPPPMITMRQAISPIVESAPSCAIITSPTAKSTPPIVARIEGPILFMNLPITGPRTRPTAGIGVTPRAALSSLYPSTFTM